MYKQLMFAIAAAVLLTAFVSVASYGLNLAHAQAGNATGGAAGNATGGAAGNATGGAAGNATGAAGANMTK